MPTKPNRRTSRAARARPAASPAPTLYPYQRRWVEDEARFKIACKARQIGFTFAAAWRVVDRRLHRPGLTVWLSASERQALEAMEHIRRFARELRVAAVGEEDFIEGTLVKQYTIRFPNRSRIVALPANPDTVRGFAGDVVLDEFAFHRDADAIWRAAFATATRGYQLEVISTPNGARGKYFELARQAGLIEAEEAKEFSSASSLWSAHWVDIDAARAQGFVVDVEALRAAIDDEDAWQQEYNCGFLAPAAHFIPPELVRAAEHPAARAELGAAQSLSAALSPTQGRDSLPAAAGLPRFTSFFLGMDIGRRRDLTVVWLLAVEHESAPPAARIYWTRGVLALERAPFSQQRATLDALLALRLPAPDGGRFRFSSLASLHALRRCAIDASGMGAMLAEELRERWGSRVEPVVFSAPVKEDLAVRVKRLLEDGRLKLPADPAVRAALGSVKRVITPAGNVRFDADRTERSGHADHFWALALALAAAEEPTLSTDYVSSHALRPSARFSSF